MLVARVREDKIDYLGQSTDVYVPEILEDYQTDYTPSNEETIPRYVSIGAEERLQTAKDLIIGELGRGGRWNRETFEGKSVWEYYL